MKISIVKRTHLYTEKNTSLHRKEHIFAQKRTHLYTEKNTSLHRKEHIFAQKRTHIWSCSMNLVVSVLVEGLQIQLVIRCSFYVGIASKPNYSQFQNSIHLFKTINYFTCSINTFLSTEPLIENFYPGFHFLL